MAKKQQPKKEVKMANPQVGLYPKGQVSKKSVDSLKGTDPKLSKMIGDPISRGKNSMPQYGTQSSDVIRKMMSSPKKKEVVAKGKKK